MRPLVFHGHPLLASRLRNCLHMLQVSRRMLQQRGPSRFRIPGKGPGHFLESFHQLLDVLFLGQLGMLGGDEICAKAFERATEIRVLDLVKRNEYKRRQAPPGVRVSRRAFGRDWRYPITSGYRR